MYLFVSLAKKMFILKAYKRSAWKENISWLKSFFYFLLDQNFLRLPR